MYIAYVYWNTHGLKNLKVNDQFLSIIQKNNREAKISHFKDIKLTWINSYFS